MAQEHDLFDDIIEISKGFDFLKNPLGGVTDALDPSAPQWNPADYKERPRGNTIPCLTCKNEKSGCTACMDVCPVNAIEVEEDAIEILDSCRKCGLCAAACPTEAIISPRLAPKNLYDDIVSAATSHETAYVTCTRALKRMPRENEVVVACVGDITAETWFSVLADYPSTCRWACAISAATPVARIFWARPLPLPRSGLVRAWAWRSTPRASSAISFASTNARSTWKRLPAPRA